MEKIDCTMRKHDFETSSYVGNFMGAYKMKEVFPKVCYEEIKEYLFEGIFCPAPKDYDTVLTQLYGDYMTPPEADMQNKHNTEVISADEEQ